MSEETQQVEEPPIYKTIFQLRGYLIIPPLLVALFTPGMEWPHDWIIWPVGILIYLMGFVIRLWAQQFVHYRLDKSKTLATDGPYNMVRNPMYIGNTLIGVGLTTMSGIIWLIPVSLVWGLLLYNLVVRYEEPHLLNKYGDPYQEYRNTVPRLIPNFTRIEGPFVTSLFQKAFLAEWPNLMLIIPFLVREYLVS